MRAGPSPVAASLCLAASRCCASHLVSPRCSRCASLIVSHPMRLSCFVLFPFFRCSMLCSVPDSLHLVKPLFHLFNALQCSRFRAACQALRPCAVSVSFRSHRSHRLRLSLLCSAALVLASLAALLSHLVWLWFIAVYFLLVPMRSSAAHLLHLVKHCGSAAALLMLHC